VPQRSYRHRLSAGYIRRTFYAIIEPRLNQSITFFRFSNTCATRRQIKDPEDHPDWLFGMLAAKPDPASRLATVERSNRLLNSLLVATALQL